MFWKKEIPQAEFNFEAVFLVAIERKDSKTLITHREKATSKEQSEFEFECDIPTHNYLVSRFRQACMINHSEGE